MLRRILFPAIFICLLFREAPAQYTPRDRCVRDSLTRIIPGMTSEQQGHTYLTLAELIWDTVPDQAFWNILAAMRISIQQNNPRLKARSRLIMGTYYSNSRDFMQAQEHYLAAQIIYNRCRDTLGEMEVLARLGALNHSLSNYRKSLDFFDKGRILALKSGNLAMTGKFLENMAIIRQVQKNYSDAERLYREAQAAFRAAGDRNNEFYINNSIGTLFLDRDQYDTALVYYLDLLGRSDTADLGFAGSLYTRIGHIYFQKKDYLTSLGYNRKALRVRQRCASHVEVNSSLINIGGDFYMLGQPDSGRYYLDRGLEMALRYDRKNLVENVYRHLYRYYQAKGDYQVAMEHFRKFVSVDSSIRQERYSSNISILEAYQQVQRVEEYGKMLTKRYSIQALNQENQGYQFTFVKVITVLAAILMIGFIFQYLSIRRVRWDMQALNVLLSDEIKERELTEHQAREREQQFRFLSENSEDFITHMDSEKRRVYASPASMRVYGFTPGEILPLTPYDLTHPDYTGYCEMKFGEMLEKKTSQQFIYQARRKNGQYFWVESVLNPLFDPATGKFKGMVGVTRDIQERKTKEFEIMEGTRQKENLLKEIHHRVKNNFAILVSLINMQMAQTKNHELLQSLTNLQLRIRTMALVHEMLYRSKDFENISFSDYLRSLASVIAGTYNRRDVKLTFEADESVMDIEASIPLGLIVNEILSNAYKHAFPDGRAGNVWITFRVDRTTGKYCLVLQDDGVGLAPGLELENCKSMGLQVVQILCQQIEATLEMTNDRGLGFTVTFKPAPKVL